MNNDNSNGKKYKFYRKPSFKKKGPEVKQTKTSLARLLIANPLLKHEIKLEKEYPTHKTNSVKSNIQQSINTSKPTIKNLAGNGPHLRKNLNKINSTVLSVSDFNPAILSSTLLPEEDDVFIPYQKTEKNDINKNENINKVELRKSISSQHFYRKKKEIHALVQGRSICSRYKDEKYLRRSKSLDNPQKAVTCYKIEEETIKQLSESRSLQNLSTIANESIMPTLQRNILDLSDQHKSYEEYIKQDDKSKENLKVKTYNHLNHLEQIDDKNKDLRITEADQEELDYMNHNAKVNDENKENFEIIETYSYENLFIPNVENIKYNIRSRKC